MRKGQKLAFIGMPIAVMLTGATFGFTACTQKVEEQTISLDKDSITVGILSDTQLTANYDKYAQNLEKSLTYLKNRGTDVLIFAGDYSDLGTQAAAERFRSVYDSVFPSEKPISVAVMGNHDYWLDYFFQCWEIPTKSKMRGRFESVFNDPYISVKVINGYTFFAFSPDDGSMEGKYNIELAREVLDKAIARDPQKPIFVVTHQNPKDTIRGSAAWGNAELDALFRNYPNVVSISGHSHYSMLDETNVMQTAYTAIGTQSLSYTDFDPGYEPFGITADIESNPMLMYMTVQGNTVTTERIFLQDEREYRPQDRYVFTFPYDVDNAPYTAARKDSAATPYFENFQGQTVDYNGVKCMQVTAAKCDDMVIEYRMRFLANGVPVSFQREGKSVDTLKYFSDFFQGYNAPTIRFAIPQDLPSGSYTVELYAMESFGNASETVTFSITV